MEKIEINKEHLGERLDKAIVSILKDLNIYIPSRSFFKNFIDDGVLVSGKNVKGSYRFKEKDILEVNIDLLKKKISDIDSSGKIIPERRSLEIIYEDSNYLIINKPKGIVVHPGAGNRKGTLSNYIRGYLEDKGEYDTLMDRGGIVHRLDKGVSGLMVVAKNKQTQEFFKKQFQNHQVGKVYRVRTKKFKNSGLDILEKKKIFLKEGEIVMDNNWMKVNGYIGRSKKNRFRMEFKSYEFDGSKLAVSHFLKIGEEEYLVKIDTGRMHQIRATLFYLGRTIIGDTLYTPGTKNFTSKYIELESVYLSFVDPSKKKKVFTILK